MVIVQQKGEIICKGLAEEAETLRGLGSWSPTLRQKEAKDGAPGAPGGLPDAGFAGNGRPRFLLAHPSAMVLRMDGHHRL